MIRLDLYVFDDGVKEEVDAVARRHGLCAECGFPAHAGTCCLGEFGWMDMHAWMLAMLEKAVADGRATASRRPQARVQVPKKMRAEVWARWYGPADRGVCPVCKKAAVSRWDFECAHYIPWHWGGPNVPGNLWPACRHCNRAMGVMRIDDYMMRLGTWASDGSEPMQIDFPFRGERAA